MISNITRDVKYVLGLDLSTTCTGWALFDYQTKKPLEYGRIKPSSAGTKLLTYPRKQLHTMRILAVEISQLISDLDRKYPNLKLIVIEEINRGTNRLGQKTLDGFHFILLDRIGHFIERVEYKDSDGRTGWRTDLGLRLSEEDKLLNKRNKSINKKAARGHKVPVTTKKHLACRFVNKMFNTAFDVDKNDTDSDVVDAIAMTYARIK